MWHKPKNPNLPSDALPTMLTYLNRTIALVVRRYNNVGREGSRIHFEVPVQCEMEDWLALAFSYSAASVSDRANHLILRDAADSGGSVRPATVR